MKFAYADPPYPGQAKKWYRDHPDYAGEVDHAELIHQLNTGYPDGWALSTSGTALQSVLALCPPDVEIGIWHVTNAQYNGTGNKIWRTYEPVIFRGGRADGNVVRNLVACGQIGGLGATIAGQKPPPFCHWLFRMLGAQYRDTMTDLFPGSGAVGQEWEMYCRGLRIQPEIGRWARDARYHDRAVKRDCDQLFT